MLKMQKNYDAMNNILNKKFNNSLMLIQYARRKRTLANSLGGRRHVFESNCSVEDFDT